MSTLRDLDRLYQLAADRTLRQIRIAHPLFRDYSVGISRLVNLLGEGVEEDLWKNVLAVLKRYRYTLSTTPLPFDSDVLSVCTTFRIARDRLPSFASAHPAAARQLSTLLDYGESLGSCPHNPVIDFILNEFPRGITSGAMVLSERRYTAQVQQLLRSHPGTSRLHVLTASQLKAERCYEQLFIVGPARWFPEYITTAPRASNISILCYGWIRDRIPTMQVFDHHWPKNQVARLTNRIEAYDPDEVVDAREILPTVDWVAIERSGVTQVDHGVDELPAKIALLESDFGVFLEDTESATVLTVDLDADDATERVQRTKVQRLVPGMFVVLRTIGGGDYVMPAADKILGSAAASLRGCQREWKAELRRAVSESSLFEVSIRLLDRGSICANEINVRNWMSLRTIKTHDRRDFAAIIDLIGRKDRTDEYWSAMVTISQAHQRAGQQIRHALIRRLQELDLTVLQTEGRLEISFPDIDAGALSAFRIVDIAPAHQLIGTGKLSHPFPIGDPYGAHYPR